MNASAYTLNENLHFKPICARIARCTGWASISLQRYSSSEWHGHILTFLSQATLVAGAILCIPLSLIESVAGFAIGSVGILINRFLIQDRSELIQKHSLKYISYSLHSLILSITALVIGLKRPMIRYQTANAIFDWVIHIGSAAFIQSTVGSAIDRSVRRGPETAMNRILNLFNDCNPDLLNDIREKINEDFHIHTQALMLHIPSLEEYFERHPEDRDILANVSLDALMNNEDYRNQIGRFVRRYLSQIQMIGAGLNQAAPLILELNQNAPEESTYQNYLSETLKNSFLQIYRTPDFHRCLDTNENSGRELLRMLDADIYVPLTTFSQYQELLQPIQCPREFTGDLDQYNPRREQLIAARNLVNTLNEQQKRVLIEKILRGPDVEVAGEIQAAYLTIHQLSSPLYQGPLMSRTVINLGGLERGEIIDRKNLFQKALQEAIAEIEPNDP